MARQQSEESEHVRGGNQGVLSVRAIGAIASIAAILSVGFAAEIASQPPSPTPSEAQHPPKTEAHTAGQDTAANKRGTYESPLVVELRNTGKSAEDAEDEKRERTEKSLSDRWMVYLTGTLALLALLQLIAFIVQAYYLRKTVEGADSANKVAHDTSRLELRPYVGVEKLFFTLEGTGQPENLLPYSVNEPSLRLAIKNFGKTPAYDVVVFVEILDETPKTPADGSSYRPSFRSPALIAQTIYPDQSHIIDLDGYVAGTEARYNRELFFVYGRIDYFDPLSRVDWSLEFCRVYLGVNHFTSHGRFNNELGIGHQY